MVFSVTYYLKLHCDIAFTVDFGVFLRTKVELVVWTLQNINMSTLSKSTLPINVIGMRNPE